MKQLLTYTSTLLRTALLLGALALLNIQTQAQTAGLPDAFETMDPATIIGDGQYYYIQFYETAKRCYLTDCGLNMKARSKDFLPYADNRLWTLVSVGVANQFKLKSKSGHFIQFGTFENQDNRYGCVEKYEDGSLLAFSPNGDGYDITLVSSNLAMYRPSYSEWTELANINHNNHRNDVCRLRFAKLKNDVAFLIYYRGEEKDNPVGNSNSGALTTRHYLTYSRTAESSLGTNWWWSNVSSRQSIIPSDMPLCKLPTVAAYHKDGLWTLEKADVEGQFYIKKYGTNQYLNEDEHWANSGIYGSELGNKDATKGIYILEDPLANRYTRIQNINYVTEPLTANMFFEWNGYGANATPTSDTHAQVNVNFGGDNPPSLSAGGTVYGDGYHVNYLKYANLTGYRKMYFEGTPNMLLRVLMNRVEPIPEGQDGRDTDGGAFLEKNVTIGNDGKAEVDLKNLTLNTTTTTSAIVKMTYISGSDGTTYQGNDGPYTIDDNVGTSYGEIAAGETARSGYNKISGGKVELVNKSWNVNEITYLQVNASAIDGNISRVTLRAQVSGSTDNRRKTHWGVGYNDSEWSASMTWNSASTDRSITTIGSDVWTTATSNYSTTFEDVEFDITQAFSGDIDKIVTILVYELEPGGGYIKNPTVEVEYYPSVPYVHLNSIKVGSGSGTISSIKLEKDEHRSLHHAHGDGWQVMQWSGEDDENDWWYAGFYPVEVVDKDEYYQVLLRQGEQMVGVDSNGNATLKAYNDFNPELWTLDQFSDYAHFRLQSWNGLYYQQLLSPLITTAPTEGNGVFINTEINSIFSSIQWLPKTETRIMHNVTHKTSNVRLYYAYNPTSAERQEVYKKQGLVTNDITEWRNDDGTQKVNEFEITHYVKKGEVVTFGLPTVLTYHNDHILYQRWYKYGDDTNLEDLKNHFRLKVGNQEVMSYLYNNGIVTGDRLDWPTVFPGAAKYELNYLTFKNCDGQSFTLAADVSRYSDFTYKNTTSHLDGDLEEASLTMRYIYHMKDAKVMAADLMEKTEGSDKWLEKKTLHFPAKRLAYETSKQEEYQGEFIGIRYQFKDYWVFNGSGTSDDNLVPAVTNSTSGKIEVVVDDGGTGITLGGHKVDGVCQGYYYYDEGNPRGDRTYGDSRFVVFRYPGETVTHSGENYKAYIKVYFNNGGTRYQIAKFEIIFDENTSTLPWDDTDATKRVKGSSRDPKELRKVVGQPIAKISFDYPKGATFKNSSDYTIHNMGVMTGLWSEIPNSSPLPLTFEKTNYGFDGDNPSWGSYALVKTMETKNGNKKTALPTNHSTQGYNIAADEGMEAAFLYIDASEQPGEICSVPFYGEFCAEDKLICSGWISGSNKIVDETNHRCPGSVILSVKGQNTGEDDETIYRFCPGQCYELDQGNYVNWQQFYFEFKVNRKYEKYWVEVNNNCVSSTGGDFMLDNIEVYAFVPEATPIMNTPICINRDASEMQLLKISVGFDKLLSAIGETEVTGDANDVDKSYALVFLEKNAFLTTFKNELATRNNINKTIAELEAIIQSGEYGDLVTTTYSTAYQNAFNAAVLGNYRKIWDSNLPNNNNDAAVLNFHWNTNFSKMEAYSFAKAVNKQGAVFAETDTQSGERLIVMNGNYSNQLSWKINTDYYVVPYNAGVSDLTNLYEDFNICSMCSKKKVFQIKPPLNILSMETSDITEELEVCEGKIPTLLTNLKGFSINGEEVELKDLNFDWWLGDLSSTPKVPATLENYHSQTNAAGTVRLDESLAYFRAYYPGVTSLDGTIERVSQTPFLTLEMIYYLQDLVEKGQLILHQKSINVPAVKVSDDDPYCYLVACPIHDGYFDQALNNGSTNVAYLCDEPQGLRMKVSEKAPSLKCGFVPNENGFTSYDYSAVNDAVLSIRLAKKAQFKTVQHGTTAEAPKEWETNADLNYLWLPIRDAKVQSTGSSKVIVKSDDYNIYLASTDDPTWDKNIYTAMSAVNAQNEPIGSLPIVGKIVKLNAIDTGKNSGATEKDQNRLCIYFTENFDVREGYNYTLSLPFREDGDLNSCDGTLLIHLKIVPDYEVWTGGAGTTDWNNDQNWRRADGNRGTSTEEPKDGAGRNNNELLVSADLPSTSGLYNYTTNFTNYRTAKDRLLRKGYAPLYCTHILIKNNEWGDDPVLYDALAGKGSLDAAPFPNLSENYEVNTINTVVDQRFSSISALLDGQSFAIVNETAGKALYGTTVQNLGYADYHTAMQYSNTGYYYKLESVQLENDPKSYYLLRLQKPEGGNYEFDAWGGHWQGYLNSQPLSGTVSFVLGLTGTSNQYTYGQDGNNLALWEIEENNGKFALKNVGTSLTAGANRYLKDNTNAKYDTPTYFTFCTLKNETVTTTQVKDNILKYDMQARVYDIWSETYGSDPDKGRTGDLIAEMYQINSCDEIAFQPTAEILNAHLLNYNNAWVETQLDMNRWYLLGSALQGTISGEWYAPTGTAQQKTTYYEPVTFSKYTPVTVTSDDNPQELGYYKLDEQNYVLATETTPVSGVAYYKKTGSTNYDRYSPAIYQRSWDKAKAVLYEVGSNYSTDDDSQTDNLGSTLQGAWSGTNWNTNGADRYLDRLGYKPMGGKKVNVAIQGVWSNTYNDATVDYATGGFSVLVKNDLKGNSNANPAIVRLPKEDTMYDYYEFAQTNDDNGGTDTELSTVQSAKNRAKNRGRLKTDLLLPAAMQKTESSTKYASTYGERKITRVPRMVSAADFNNLTFNETVSAGASNLGFFLVENPFQCGLNMDAFFAKNPGLQKKYWLLTTTGEGAQMTMGQQLVQQVGGEDWISPDGTSFTAAEAVIAPGQGFFVQATAAGQNVNATWNFTGNSAMATEAERLSFSTTTRTLQAAENNGILLTVEANGAKIRDNSNSVNMQTGVVLKVPVVSTNDVVTVTGFNAPYYFYTIDGVAASTPVTAHTATTSDVDRGYVEIASTHDNNYFVSIVVEQDPTAATATNKSTSITFTDDMQAQTRFGKKSNEGTTFNVIVGTKTVLKDDDDDPDTPDVEVIEDITEDIVIYSYVQDTDTGKEFPLKARTRGNEASSTLGMVITAQLGADESSALVMKSESASDDFLPEEDTEAFINSDLKNVPTVYTLCGRLATTINSIHDFTCLPLGVESGSEAPCTLTFNGVELLGDSVAFYDAVRQELTPLQSGMKFTVSGQTQNRYYLVHTLVQEEAAKETHLQIFTNGLTAKAIASTAEPITSVRCFNVSGKLIHTANPYTPEYSFSLPNVGVYIIEAKTDSDRKTKKLMAK